MLFLRREKLLVIALLSFGLSPAGAQTPGTGAIEGTVKDASGLVVVNADIQIVNDETQLTRHIQSGRDGSFRSTLLPPGSYSLRITHDGFAVQEAHHITVMVAEPSIVAATLSVASANQSVNVTDSSQLLQTESATLGRTVDSEAVNALPLSNRNFTQILSLSPGVIVELPSATALGRASQNVVSSGQKATANNFQFNGIDANNLAQNAASNASQEVGIAIPAPDMIEEYKVQTANYDASYGRGTGANVDIVTKSGTNQFHGTVWEFLRNDLFVANLFYRKNDGQLSRPTLKQNQFGASVGGPILRDKLFFFGGYQGWRMVNGLGGAVTTFLPALGNDRSAATIGAAFCSSGPTSAGGTQVACDGSNINPVAIKLLNAKLPDGSFAIPTPQKLLPVVAGQTPEGQSTFSPPDIFNENQYILDTDLTLSGKDQLAERFFYSRGTTSRAFAANAANVPGWGSDEADTNVLAALEHTHVFGPNTINLARIGYTRFAGNALTQEPLSAGQIGSQSPTGIGGGVSMPSVLVSGLFSLGDGGVPGLLSSTNSYIAQDTLSMTRGRHGLSAGIEYKHYQVMVNQAFISNGVMEMQTFNDFLIGQSAAQNGSPDGFSNIWLTAASSGLFRKDQRYNDISSFIQDGFHLTHSLFLSAGLRYEIYLSPTEANNRFATFNPAIATGDVPGAGSLSGFEVPANFPGTLPTGVTRSGQNGFWPNHFADLSPRFGFAWQPLNQNYMVVRGGYGIYYDRLSAGLLENLVGATPFALDQVLFFGQTAGSTEQAPFSPTLPAASTFPSFIPRQQGGAQTINAVDPDIVDPFTHEYNLNIQTKFAHDYLFEVGYVGTYASHIPGGVEFNQAQLASPQHPIHGETTNTGSNITNRLPFQGIAASSIIYQSRFHSNYNALQASLTKRISHGLQFLASYTFSKSLDETSGTGGASFYEEWLLSNDQNNPRQAYGPTDFNRPHRGVLSLVYQVSRLMATNRPASLVLRDWQFSAIAVAQSGSSLTATDGNAGLVYGNFENRAQKPTGNPYTTGPMAQRAVTSYLDASVFPSAPIAPGGQSASDTDFGNSSTGFLHGPGQRDIDFALQRRFPVTERIGFIFRSEFFNATNTTNFVNPNTNVSSGGAFGTITGTSNNPRIVQFAGKIVF